MLTSPSGRVFSWCLPAGVIHSVLHMPLARRFTRAARYLGM